MAEEDFLLQEVSDELKAERLRRWWQRFGSVVAVCCIGLVVATIGYQYHINSVNTANESTTSLLLGSDELLQRKQYDSAAEKLLALPEGTKDVALLARLKAADALEKSGKHKEAQREYRIIASVKHQPAFANYAQLRLGQADQIAPEAPYAALANELQAVELYHQGKKEAAQKLLASLANSPETPAATRNRVNELIAAFQ